MLICLLPIMILYLCVICLYIAIFVLFIPCVPLTFLFPLFAPAALLLKLRQVSFVSTVYWKSWNLTQWFSFFGVVNNVIGLTATEGELIGAYHRIMLRQP